MVSMRTVTGDLSHVDGTPWTGALVVFAMRSGPYTVLPALTYPQERQGITTGDDGSFTLELTAGLGIWWACHLPDGDAFLFALDEGDPVTIERLRAEATGAPVPISYPLSDIVITAPEAGQILRHNGTQFVNVDWPDHNVVEGYGAVGNGVADDTAAIAAAIAAAAADDGKVLFPAGTYKTTATLTLPAGVTLEGQGPTSVIAPSGTGFDVFYAVGAGGSIATVASNAAENARAVSLSAGGVASLGLGREDYFRLYDNNSFGRSMINQVGSISGDTLNIIHPLVDTFTTAAASSVRKIIPGAGVSIRHLAIDGTNLLNSGAAARGIHFHTMRHCVLHDLSLRYLADAAILLEYGYGHSVTDITMTRCGSLTDSDLFLVWQTAFRVDGVLSQSATGFGPGFKEAHLGTVTNLTSSAATDRAVKLQASRHNQFQNIVANSGGMTGLSIVYGSSHNRFDGGESIGNTLEGLWFYGTFGGAPGNTHNTITNWQSNFNGNYNLAFNVGDANNLVVGKVDTSDGSIRQLGTDNVLIQTNQGAGGVHLRGPFQVSTVDSTGDGVATSRLAVTSTGLSVGGALALTGVLSIPDGVTAPATAAVCQLYVDAADGDFKIKFSDGTTKTITTDT